MACNYAEGLSKYKDKGICGVPEIHDSQADLDRKIESLANMMKEAKHVVFHTGAGISTSAGIPDFRGPNGVWTLENQGTKPEVNVSFKDAVPTATHMALVALAKHDMIHFLISQNIDGLHLRSNFPPEKFAELHGNMFLDKCNYCERLFVRNDASQSVGQKCTSQVCPLPKPNGRRCRGKLHDTILDWEDELPNRDLELAELHSRKADLSVCLGSTLQIVPSGKLPLLTKKSCGKLVICNLQPTKHDKQADLLIRGYVDDIMKKLLTLLGVEIPEYKLSRDPTNYEDNTFKEYVIESANKNHVDQCKTIGYYEKSKRLKRENDVKDKKEENHVEDRKEENHVEDRKEENHVEDKGENHVEDKGENHVEDKKEENHVEDKKEENHVEDKEENHVEDKDREESHMEDKIKEENDVESRKEENDVESRQDENHVEDEKDNVEDKELTEKV